MGDSWKEDANIGYWSRASFVVRLAGFSQLCDRFVRHTISSVLQGVTHSEIAPNSFCQILFVAGLCLHTPRNRTRTNTRTVDACCVFFLCSVEGSFSNLHVSQLKVNSFQVCHQIQLQVESKRRSYEFQLTAPIARRLCEQFSTTDIRTLSIRQRALSVRFGFFLWHVNTPPMNLPLSHIFQTSFCVNIQIFNLSLRKVLKGTSPSCFIAFSCCQQLVTILLQGFFVLIKIFSFQNWYKSAGNNDNSTKKGPARPS